MSTDENVNGELDPIEQEQVAPINQSTQTNHPDSYRDQTEDTPMKKDNESTATADTTKEVAKQDKPKGEKKTTPATAGNETPKDNKKNNTAIIMAVIALALGVFLIYLRNRNARKAKELAEQKRLENEADGEDLNNDYNDGQ